MYFYSRAHYTLTPYRRWRLGHRYTRGKNKFNHTGEALSIILTDQRTSTAKLQSKMQIDYPRARRIMSALEFIGAVTPPGPDGRREVLWKNDDVRI